MGKTKSSVAYSALVIDALTVYTKLGVVGMVFVTVIVLPVFCSVSIDGCEHAHT